MEDRYNVQVYYQMCYTLVGLLKREKKIKDVGSDPESPLSPQLPLLAWVCLVECINILGSV